MKLQLRNRFIHVGVDISSYVLLTGGLRQLKADEEFHLKLGEYMERRGRAAAPTAPMETAPAPPRSVGLFMPSTIPELRGRDILPTFLQCFPTWASISGCNSAFNSEIIVRTSGTPRAELERVHDPRLVDNSLNA